jgi:hypothetical protein
MWIFLNDAMLSIVAPEPRKGRGAAKVETHLIVRARFKGDLPRTFGRGVKVEETPGRDYRFRAVVTRKKVADVLARRILDVDYTNFKGSVPDDARHRAYLRVWTVMEGEQRAVYGTARRFGYGSYDDDLFGGR